MRVNRITATKFLGLEALYLPLREKVTVILGPNAAGKSSIRDAVQFAVTGLARGITVKNRTGALAKDGLQECSVTVEAEGKRPLTRTPQRANASEATIAADFGDPDVWASVLNAFRFLDLSLPDRRDLIAGICKGKATARALLADEAAKAGLLKTDVDVLLAGYDHSIDDAEKHAVNERRAAKRTRDSIAMPAQPPPASITVAGTEFDLDTQDADSIKDRLAKLHAQLADALKRSGAGTATDRASIEARIKAADEILAAMAGAATDTAAEDAELDRLAAQEAACRKPIAEADAKLAMLAERSKALNKIKGSSCPTCGQGLTPETRAKLKAQLASEETHAMGELAKAKEPLAAITKALEATRRKRHDVANAVQKRLLAQADKRRALEELADADRAAAGAGAAAKEVEVLRGRIATGTAINDAHAALLAYRQGLQKQAIQDEAIARWDGIAHVLGPDGPVRKAASEGFDVGAVQLLCNSLLPSLPLDVRPDWSISVGGRPSDLLSRSERYRVGAAFAAVLAKTSGIGFCIVDEADVLQSTLRPDLLGALLEVESVQSIVLATRPDRPESLPACEGIEYLWLEPGGKVSRIPAVEGE